ncbi:hypothetical protein ACLB6G_20250 [Zhengella sp. ZM62]|uniref:hypothetical protein n=1 Tax=Zhengella sedimenti TaxID=3390035 RepID=UPI003975BD11
MRVKIASGVIAYLLAVASFSAYGEWQDFKDRKERLRQARAEIYAPVTQVQWRIDGDRLLIVAAVSRKLEPCTVRDGSPVTLVARWSEASSTRYKSYPAFSPEGDMIEGAPLILTGEEFLVGPFVIEDRPAILRRIESVSVRLPCSFDGGVTRTATIGPLERPR